MEFYLILERDIVFNIGLWYVLFVLGDFFLIRVGYICIYVKGLLDGDNGKLYVIGGVNFSGVFCDIFVFDFNFMMWDIVDYLGFRVRYEYVVFVS